MEKEQMSNSNRLLAVMAMVLVGLIAVAAIIVAVREPATFEPDTPEGATQAYLMAVLDDEPEVAHSLLTPDLQRRCTEDDLENRYHRESGRITLVDSDIVGDSATIELEFTATYSDDPFNLSASSYNERFKLERVGDEWRISDVPWPFYWCSGEDES